MKKIITIYILTVLTGLLAGLYAVDGFAGTTAKQIDFLLAGYRHPVSDAVLSGGKVKTFLTGTSTLSSLWTDQAKGATATNPFTLDSSGKAEVYGDNLYKFEIYDSDDVLLETISGLRYTDDSVGDLTGDVLAADGTKVLENGTDGSDATFTGVVTGSLVGNSLGIHVGEVRADDMTGVLDPGADGSAVILNAGGISGTAILDEDDMASNSAVHLATQQSIKALFDTLPTRTELFLSSGTFDVPAGVTFVFVDLLPGGGGGGGGSTTDTAPGGAGASAPLVGNVFHNVTPLDSLTVTVGGGGVGGVATGNGGIGGTTSFDTISVTGGDFGNGSATGGTGGTASTAQGVVSASDGGGGNSNGIGTIITSGGVKGATDGTFLGGGGGGATLRANGAAGGGGNQGGQGITGTSGGANTGVGGGGGGSGSTNGGNGGPGGSGYALVRY